MIKIIAKMLVKEGKVEELKSVAAELVKKSQAEEGNIFYTLNVSTENPNLLVFIECWKDQEAINFHNATEHFTRIVPQMGALCEKSYPVELFNEVEY